MAEGFEGVKGKAAGAQVWTDPVTAACQRLTPGALPQMMLGEGTSVVAACALNGHWSWQKLAGLFHVWCSVSGAFLAKVISHIQWLFSKVAREPLQGFRFKDAGPRNVRPGLTCVGPQLSPGLTCVGPQLSLI